SFSIAFFTYARGSSRLLPTPMYAGRHTPMRALSSDETNGARDADDAARGACPRFAAAARLAGPRRRPCGHALRRRLAGCASTSPRFRAMRDRTALAARACRTPRGSADARANATRDGRADARAAAAAQTFRADRARSAWG